MGKKPAWQTVSRNERKSEPFPTHTSRSQHIVWGTCGPWDEHSSGNAAATIWIHLVRTCEELTVYEVKRSHSSWRGDDGSEKIWGTMWIVGEILSGPFRNKIYCNIFFYEPNEIPLIHFSSHFLEALNRNGSGDELPSDHAGQKLVKNQIQLRISPRKEYHVMASPRFPVSQKHWPHRIWAITSRV